jgi:hypothetical protein
MIDLSEAGVPGRAGDLAPREHGRFLDARIADAPS